MLFGKCSLLKNTDFIYYSLLYKYLTYRNIAVII